jgi:hypothetical protein
MTPKIPEIKYIHPPYEVEGTPKEARESFYEFVKERIKYLTDAEIRKWDKDRGGDQESKGPLPALYIISVGESKKEDKPEKWINNLEIVVNKDAFKIKDKDYSDVMPFVVEHEIYETWLNAKKGAGSDLESVKQHTLALRKAFLLAEQQDLGDKLLEWNSLIDPDNPRNKKLCEYALRVAKKQLAHKKS